MPRKPIGEIAMTNAERQARYRAAPGVRCMIIVAGPGAGPTTSTASWKHRLSSRRGWKACRTTFKTVRPPRRCARSAIWISANFRRPFHHAASVGTDQPPPTLTQRDAQGPPAPFAPRNAGALRYGRGSLLCMTWISPASGR